jgi:uncharacterized protein
MPTETANIVGDPEIIADIVDFCRFARDHGLLAGVKQTLDCIRVLERSPEMDRETFKYALRSILSSSKEDWDCFGDLFELFWARCEIHGATEREPDSRDPDGSSLKNLGNPAATEPDPQHVSQTAFSAGRSSKTPENCLTSGLSASAAERLSKTDFSKVATDDLYTLDRIAQRLLSRMSIRLSRRLKIRVNGSVDLRRTIRRSISRGGDPRDLSYKGRKKKQVRLVIFIDISGSMEMHSLFLLRFAYFLQKHFKHAQTLIFSTNAVNVTRALESSQISSTLDSLSQVTAGWSGGTRIGESLRDFRIATGAQLLSRDTVFIMFSDGLDTGEPDLLAEQMSAIKRLVRKVIWLNPLMGMENYRPIAKGISAALPFIDVFAPAHNLESLLQLEHRLCSALRD